MTEKYLSPKQIAARLNVAKSTVYSLVACGLLPCVRIGQGRGTIRVLERDVEAYLEKQKRDDEKTYAEHFA